MTKPQAENLNQLARTKSDQLEAKVTELTEALAA